MPRYDFSALLERYPEIIAAMPDEFTSHEFILALAQRHQRLYVEALHAYRDVLHQGATAPFRTVHGILAKRLHDFEDLIVQEGTAFGSKDIFGHPQQCAKWRKLQ